MHLLLHFVHDLRSFKAVVPVLRKKHIFLDLEPKLFELILEWVCALDLTVSWRFNAQRRGYFYYDGITFFRGRK